MAASDHFEKRILRARLCGLDRIQGSGSLHPARTDTRPGREGDAFTLPQAPFPSSPVLPFASGRQRLTHRRVQCPGPLAPSPGCRSVSIRPSVRPSVHACVAALTQTPLVHLRRSAPRSQPRSLSPGPRTTCPPRPGALGL